MRASSLSTISILPLRIDLGQLPLHFPPISHALKLPFHVQKMGFSQVRDQCPCTRRVASGIFP